MYVFVIAPLYFQVPAGSLLGGVPLVASFIVCSSACFSLERMQETKATIIYCAETS